MDQSYLFTSESVSEGHPDKIADQISDAILDGILAQDPRGRVACETLVKTGIVVLAGEITTTAKVDLAAIARKTIGDIGYDDGELGFDSQSCGIVTCIENQSPDIAMGVNEGEGLHHEMGAGDQGMMFGYACDETEEYMPASISYAHGVLRHLAKLRHDRAVKWLRPDAKAQVTVEDEAGALKRIHTVVVSTQHHPDVDHKTIEAYVVDECIKRVIPNHLLSGTIYHINPTGRFVTGGPAGDAGLTGRKIIVDSYGGHGAHGGGAFSGKDPSKVDRTAAYMGRYIAKNLVAAGLARRCLVQLAYAIGVADPVSVCVESYGTSRYSYSKLADLVREHFGLTPRRMIECLGLLTPIYRQTAAYGHFGRNQFPWERLDRVSELKGS